MVFPYVLDTRPTSVWLLHTDYCTNPFLSCTLTRTAMRWTVLLTLALLPHSPPPPSPLQLQRFPSKRLRNALLTVCTQTSFSQALTTSGTSRLSWESSWNKGNQFQSCLGYGENGIRHNVCIKTHRQFLLSYYVEYSPLVTAFHGGLDSYSFLHTHTNTDFYRDNFKVYTLSHTQ